MITFYATISYGQTRDYMPDVPWLLPASSWSRNNLSKPKLPPHVKHVAADSGGFVATFKWGDYRYTPDEYVRWLSTFDPHWAATMDYCCEKEIAENAGVVRQRQQRTSEMAYRFWADYRDTPWQWVPTVQGWEVEDYRRHALELKPLIREMHAAYGSDSAFRVGIGTLCARADTRMILRVLDAVTDVLPDVPIHLWGVKLAVLKSRVHLPQVVSVDSAAWCPGGLGRDGVRAREERKALGMTQVEHWLTVALPRYLKKVDDAVNAPKQMTLL